MDNSDADKRFVDRQPVLKSAKIHFRRAVVDCLVLDISASGLRIGTETPVGFPDQVTIELRSGAMWSAEKRWERGLETGFELLAFTGLNSETALRASDLYDGLRTTGVPTILDMLARESYFDSPVLKEAALGLSQSYTRLDDAFQQALHRP